jgi:hypothetical protein
MTTMASDILQYENILREAGVSEKQANAHAKGTALIIENNIATKLDIKFLELKIEQVKRETRIFGSVILAGITILGLLINFHH